MRGRGTTAVVIILVVSIGAVLSVIGYVSFHIRPATVELRARAPEKGNWSPQTIRVTRGEEVTLVIRNVDVVSHGFYLPEFGLTVGQIKAGEVKEITFTPDSAGEFTFYCSMWCSDYHMQMRGKLIVR